MVQSALCSERGVHSIAGGIERGRKGVADDLEDMATVRCNRFMQNAMMLGEQRRLGVSIAPSPLLLARLYLLAGMGTGRLMVADWQAMRKQHCWPCLCYHITTTL